MSKILSKAKRRIYLRRIKGFWLDFSHNKIGILGSTILILFIIIAVLSPILAPQDPIFQHKVAAKYARPSWITIFDPYFRSQPPTLHFPFNVTLAPENQTCTTITLNYPEESLFEIEYQNDGNLANQTYIFESQFNYAYDEPPDWIWNADWETKREDLDYRIEVHFKSPNGSEWIVWGIDYDIVTERVKVLQQHWNIGSGSALTGAGSTDLKRRIYYEKFYEQYLAYFLELYPFANVTFPPQFITFTYEGYRNVTSLNQTGNPIYDTYLELEREKQTNATWTEYWEEWINSTYAQEMWDITSEYRDNSWKELADDWHIQNITRVLENSTLLNEYLANNTGLFRPWYKGARIPGTTIAFKDIMPWDEYYTIFNLTLTTVKDEYDLFVEAMNKTDLSSPAYDRWNNLWNYTDTELPWDLYLPAWLHIQWWYGRNSFINNYIQGLRIGPYIAIKYAKRDAYSAAASSPRPTYYMEHKGMQTLRLYLFIVPKSENATLNLTFSDSSTFTVWGAIYGLLGTTSFGFDVWTQLVHGARISLLVGILAAVISTSLGISFGVTAGYIGGITDEVTMRIVDILLCLPVLPLLLALSAIWRPNVYYLVLIIAIFGWQGLSRIIRSKVLSLREMPFIESARASGAGSSYLIIRHLIPNVFPIAMAAMVLAVPGAILTEAALSYLGFGDPFAPTWGKMLHEAQAEGAFGALAWWYILPPGFAITFICLAFVFISHALDEIVNPKLRRRR